MYSATYESSAFADHPTPSNSEEIRRAKRKEYTRKTRYVAQWLKDEAKDLPGIAALLEKQFREYGRQPYDLKLKNYIRLAKRLVDEENFSVTADVMEAIYSVIDLRIECNNIHKKEGISTAEERQKHEYPVQVFQKLAEILLPKLTLGSISLNAEADTISLSSSAVGQAQSEQEARDADWPKLPGKH